MRNIRSIIDEIRDIQAEMRNPRDEDGELYHDSDWDDRLADLAVLLADAVEPKLKDNGGPRAQARREHEARMDEIDRMNRRAARAHPRLGRY